MLFCRVLRNIDSQFVTPVYCTSCRACFVYISNEKVLISISKVLLCGNKKFWCKGNFEKKLDFISRVKIKLKATKSLSDSK